MTEHIIVHDKEELGVYKRDVIRNLQRNIEAIQQILVCRDALEAFKEFKFEKVAVEPLTGRPENLIEVINQSHTYLISIMAVEYLFQKHPKQEFTINWGNIPGYDIESIDGTIVAECFAATSYRSNGKLAADLKRLASNSTAVYKYEFFYDEEFLDSHRAYYKDKYPDIEIVKFQEIR